MKLDELLEEIDGQIQAIDNSKTMRAAQKLIEKKNRLTAARRALLGAGPRTTGGSGGSRVTQDEVTAWFRAQDDGSVHTVDEIAAAMGHSPEVVRGHLNRGKGERFVKVGSRGWALRDPKNGFTDEDDFDEEDE